MANECPRCHTYNPEDSKFCKECAIPLPLFEKDLHTKTVETSFQGLLKGSIFAERYRIIEELGAGGMGIVYKADDMKLKRTVALKSLSPFLMTKEEVKIRFLREAQAAAALNHSNICTIYEIDEYEERSFISMEYIEGEALKDKISTSPFSIENALKIAIQVTEGLQHAHDRGIVHRDIKSSNIMVKKNGETKITDFGLAKLADSSVVTKEGTTVGTVMYMSPEQAKGESVDRRTDIWSLGVVMYEILSGQLPFRGDRDQAIVYAILKEEPQPLTSLRSGIPLELERIVGRCLEKEPKYRYQNSSDLLADLRRLKRDLEKGRAIIYDRASTLKHKGLFSKWLALVTAALIPVAILAALYLLSIKPNLDSARLISQLRLIPVIGGSESSFSPSWSSDGMWIAYASDAMGSMDIWRKPIAGGEAIRLTTSLSNESHPTWSPDNSMIAYSSDEGGGGGGGGGIFIIPSNGGSPLEMTSFGTHPSWSPDGKTLVYDWCGNIYLVSYPKRVQTLVVEGTSAIPHAVWTPDSKKLIYWDRTRRDIFIYFLKDKKAEPLGLIPIGEEVSGLTLSKNGSQLVLSRGPFGGKKNLWRVKLNSKNGKARGHPRLLSVTTTEDIECEFSPDGKKLVFTASQLERHLWSYPIDAETGLINGNPERITHKSHLNYYPELSCEGEKLIWTSHLTNQGVLSLFDFASGEERKVTQEWDQKVREVGGTFSPDGRQICYSSTKKGSYQIYHLPSLDSIAMEVTTTAAHESDGLPILSPDGTVLAFYSNRSGNWDIWSVRVEGGADLKQLTDWPSNENYISWSPDGKKIAFSTNREGNGDIWIMDSDGENKESFVKGPSEEGWSAWSRDGQWFYFISNRIGGAFNVWMMPAAGGEIRQVTSFNGINSGLPDVVLYTKFALSSSRLILPLETRKGEIYILENLNE